MHKKLLPKSLHVTLRSFIPALVVVALTLTGSLSVLTAHASALSMNTVVQTAPTVTVFSQDCVRTGTTTCTTCADINCLINRYVNPFIKVGSALVGVVVTISIIYGGIQYSAAAGDPNKISAAKSRIGKSLGALVMFIFLYAFLNYIIPGGV